MLLLEFSSFGRKWFPVRVHFWLAFRPYISAIIKKCCQKLQVICATVDRVCVIMLLQDIFILKNRTWVLLTLCLFFIWCITVSKGFSIGCFEKSKCTQSKACVSRFYAFSGWNFMIPRWFYFMSFQLWSCSRSCFWYWLGYNKFVCSRDGRKASQGLRECWRLCFVSAYRVFLYVQRCSFMSYSNLGN